MKILYVTNSDDKYGGAQCLKELIEQMQKFDDVEIEVLNPSRNKLNEWCDEHGIKNYSVKYYTQMYSCHDSTNIYLIKYLSYLPRYYIKNRLALRNIEEKIDIDSFDIIHTNTAVIDIGAQIAKKHGIRHIWHLREFGKEGLNLIPYRPNCYRKMNSYKDTFVAVSDAVKKDWSLKGISPKKITRIYDGVKVDEFEEKKNYFDHEKIKIAFCGSIFPFKGPHRMVEAFGLMPVEKRKLFQVDIWGNGPKEYTDLLKQKVEDYGLTDVISFRGYTNDLYKKLSEYDVGINCSNSEGFGRSTVEYMLAGLLVIASNTGANAEVLLDGKLGILFDNNAPKELCDKLLWLIDHRREAEAISRSAREYAKNMFSIQNNGVKFYEYYNHIING